LIDQSTNQETEQSIATFLDDARFHYISTSTKGLGRARNIGLQMARAELIAFTDDDCTVPPNWLEVMAETFANNPRVAIAFCNVEAAPHDNSQGFIPAYVRSDNKLVRNYWDKCRARGIGAGVAVRRNEVLALGGFDAALGAGGHFPSCEDGDVVMRALARGHWVYETCEVSVLHYGFRSWSEGKELTRRDWIGIGAAYAKPLRCGYWNALVVVLYEALVPGFFIPLSAILRLRRPQGFRRLLYFIQGFWQGWYTPIDRQKMLFQLPPLIAGD
jgi:glycosyltransferase involved in cell wall biosynthesis